MSVVVPVDHVAGIRVVRLEGGDLGFVGKDVSGRFGYANHNASIAQHCRGPVIHALIQTHGGAQRARVLLPDDVVLLAAGSRMPKANEFAKSLFDAMGIPHVVIKDNRDEIKFGEDVVERLFSGYTIIRQFPVFGGKYKIDWYVPELRLAIEFDEAHHTSPKNSAADAARQAEIEAALGCRFLRYKQKGE